jgi:hypothetical protein
LITEANHIEKPPVRSRVAYGGLIALVIIAGILWRSGWIPLPSALSKYGGDALWSLMVFLGFGFLFPGSSTRTNAIRAVTLSFTVELSQLYHAPWIDAVRRTRLGALALGSVFNWPDFIAYAVGVVVGVFLEWGWRRNRLRTPLL